MKHVGHGRKRFLVSLLPAVVIALASLNVSSAQVRSATKYVCPMHVEITSPTPGTCSRCNMELVRVSAPTRTRKRRKPARVKRRSAAPVQASSASPSLAPQVPGSRLTASQRLKEMERLAPTYDYTCVMHRDVHQAQPGTCPVCGMGLVSVNPSIRGAYQLQLTSTPRAVKPGREVRLRFVVRDPQTGSQVKQFVLNHEKLFHLFVVSQDMNDYQHIHPRLAEDGSFAVDTVLPRAGSYQLHSDFFPVNGTPQVIRLELKTAGHRPMKILPAHLVPDTKLSKTVDGLTISLTLGNSGEAVAGDFVPLKYHLTEAATGEVVRDLEPYLGAWGHTVILNADQSAYLHSHPTEMLPSGVGREKAHGGPDVEFGAMFPEGGNYRIWTQFQRAGKVVTVSFTVRVLPERSSHHK